ncbi:hypothetical protein EV421DRAFT_616574 [Armillaria borealis]|uniref:Uncharacterized protein n=1 Tax=Armillaria borealis TaxID=47425 RepID=A0AA39MQE1_9AGAR|nr:hypothetical protein EV421DRAFT_616574 [Armillaria borealis]
MLNLGMATHRSPSTLRHGCLLARYKVASGPPLNHYFTFSIDVAATLELYCDGGDENMLEKLDRIQTRQWAGYCTGSQMNSNPNTTLSVCGWCSRVSRNLILGNPSIRPTMCVPILLAIAHPTSRKPLAVMMRLPWDNCYHRTCYGLFVHVPI